MHQMLCAWQLRMSFLMFLSIDLSPLTELGKLIKKSPQYVDRIFYIISVMIENASYDDVWGSMPSFAFLRVFIDDIIDEISLTVLKALYEAVPNEKNMSYLFIECV